MTPRTGFLPALWPALLSAMALAVSTPPALAASAGAVSSPAAPAARAFPVIGYFPSWTGAEPSQVPLEKLTHVNYSFIGPTAGGGLTEVNAKLLGSLVAEARKRGVKVSVAIGGWNNGNTSDWESMAKKPRTRRKFVKNVLEFCEFYRLDGVDIDWEYPNAASAKDYAALMKELGEALHKSGRILTTAVINSGDGHGAHILPEVFGYIDYLNIMAYDGNYNQPGKSHSTLGAADSSLDYWLARGCPKAKAVLGLPFYGRMPEKPYREIIAEDPGAHRKDRVGEVFYNGVPTMELKTALALRNAGGVMIWEVTQDTRDSTSLLTAIHRAIAAAGEPKAAR